MTIQLTEDQHQQFGSHLKPVVNPGANGVPFQPLTSQKASGGGDVPINFPLTFVRPDGTTGVIYPRGQES